MHQHPQRPSLAPHQLDCVSFIVTIVRHAKRRPPHYQQQSYPSVAAAGAYAPHQLLAPGPWGPPAAGSYQVPGPPAAPELGLSLAGEGGVSGCKVGRHRTSLILHSSLPSSFSAPPCLTSSTPLLPSRPPHQTLASAGQAQQTVPASAPSRQRPEGAASLRPAATGGCGAPEETEVQKPPPRVQMQRLLPLPALRLVPLRLSLAPLPPPAAAVPN